MKKEYYLEMGFRGLTLLFWPIIIYKWIFISNIYIERNAFFVFCIFVYIQLVFVLAFFNKIQIAETLGVALVTQVVGVFTAYAVKAFFETYAEAKDTIEYTKIGIDKDNASNSISVG